MSTQPPPGRSSTREYQAQRAAARPDTTTPLHTGAMMPTEELPDLRKLDQPRSRPLVLSVTILHRGRMVTISSEGRSLDEFCDLLDSRLGVAR
jgi:uncharacterized membrane protein YccC